MHTHTSIPLAREGGRERGGRELYVCTRTLVQFVCLTHSFPRPLMCVCACMYMYVCVCTRI